MNRAVAAIFEKGVLRPLEPLHLAEQEQVSIRIKRENEFRNEDDEELFDDDYASLCAAEADDAVSIEEVRQRLSKIKGSMDEAIDEDRGEH